MSDVLITALAAASLAVAPDFSVRWELDAGG